MSTLAWTLIWIGWLGMFAVLEGIALRDKRREDSFSEFTWRLLKIRDRRPTAATWVARVLLIIGGVWLTGHLAFGIWSF